MGFATVLLTTYSKGEMECTFKKSTFHKFIKEGDYPIDYVCDGVVKSFDIDDD